MLNRVRLNNFGPLAQLDCMTFGPYPEGTCFPVEKSETYRKIKDEVKIAEFLLLKNRKKNPPAIWVVEARSSSPRPETQPNFDDFIAEIREKWINAFALGWASCLKRHEKTDAELPELFKNRNRSDQKRRCQALTM
ncbi:MAG: hypothetical protein HQL98_08135 [Magnetococcales bacterium]|nr:hypothetical protein [Magnetococcales bacterium]